MLGLLRRKMKIILWFIIVGITVTFVFFGINTDISRHDDRPSNAGELFGEPVSHTEFSDAYRAIGFNAYLGRRNLSREQINQLAWDRLMMLKEARKSDITVPDREIAGTIRQQFSNGGRFIQEFYETSLRLTGITPGTYERWVGESLMIERLLDNIKQTVWMPDAEIEHQLREQKTKFTIDYHLVNPEELKKKVRVSEEEIRAYYEEHKAQYKTPPRVNAHYVLIAWEKDVEIPEITEGEIEDYYAELQAEFKHGERVKARHILLAEKGKDREEEQKKALEKAEKLLKKLRKGADFAKLARSYSIDKATKEKGGDLGFIERRDMPPAFSEKAFALKEGEISEPVKTHRGYHIITVDEKQEPGVKPLGEVREKIGETLAREKKQTAQEEVRRKEYSTAVDFSLTLVDNPNLDEVARKFSMEVKETGPFAENDELKELGRSREFNSAAFSTEVGSFSDIIEVLDRGYVIIVPKEKIEETIKPLDEMRGEISKELTEKKAGDRAHGLAATQREEVEKRMIDDHLDFPSACGGLSLKTEESKPFSARGPIPGLGYEPQIAKAVPGLKLGKLSPVFDTAKGSCFFTVLKREEPSNVEIAKEIETFRRRALIGEGAKAAREWKRRLEERAEKIDYISTYKPAAD